MIQTLRTLSVTCADEKKPRTIELRVAMVNISFECSAADNVIADWMVFAVCVRNVMEVARQAGRGEVAGAGLLLYARGMKL